MHFDAPAYTGGEVALVLPHARSGRCLVSVRVEGDFMSHHPFEKLTGTCRRGERLVIDRAENLPGDFRHFIPTLTVQAASPPPAPLGSRSATRKRRAPPRRRDRIDEALAGWPTRASPIRWRRWRGWRWAMAGRETEAMIDATLPAIEDCWDCADFALVPLLWGRTRFGHLLSDRMRARIDAAMLGYRYWMDEPGNDVQWYFSENHALLFHTSAYLAGPAARRDLSALGPQRADAVATGATACAPGLTISRPGRWPSSTRPPISRLI
jgi:hypothetical protein